MRISNVLLIYPQPALDKAPRFGFSVQLLQIAKLIKDKGYNTFYLDYSYQDYDSNEFKTYLSEKNIDLCIIEVDTFALKRSENCDSARTLLDVISTTSVKSIVFGYDCIMDTDDSWCADVIIREDPFKSIISSISYLGGEVEMIRSTEYDFDSLPFPDRELLLTIPFFKNNGFSTLIKTANGCLNSCTFCQRRGWQKTYQAHNENYVIAEFVELKKHGYRNVWINDENFTFDLPRAKRILKALIDNKISDDMKIVLSSWTRIDKEFLDLAKMAHVTVISMGLESANPEILEFYNKKIDLDKAKGLIDYADSIGLYTVGNFIIGAPMESEDTITKTFDYIRASKLDQVNIKVLDYMLGSVLYERLGRTDEHHYFGCSENGLCQFSLEYLSNRKRVFLQSFYEAKKERMANKIKQYGVPYYPLQK